MDLKYNFIIQTSNNGELNIPLSEGKLFLCLVQMVLENNIDVQSFPTKSYSYKKNIGA
jgi:hypothetical protein